nr:uncharacterized protein LOC115269462 [Aedes albopictus]
MEVNQRESREQILSKHLEFSDLSNRQLGKMLNIHHSTVSRVLKRFQERLDYGKGAGRKPGPENKKTEGKVKRMIKANPNVSSRDLAKKIGISQSYVQNAKKRAGLHLFTGKGKFDVDDKFKKKKMSKFSSKYLI